VCEEFIPAMSLAATEATVCHKRLAGVSPEKGAHLIIQIAQTDALCHHSDYILVLYWIADSLT
jgi:hypothetical protein